MKYVDLEYTHYDNKTSAAMSFSTTSGEITMLGSLPHGATVKLTQEAIDGLQELLDEQKAWKPRYTKAQMQREYGDFLYRDEMNFVFQNLRLFDELPPKAREYIEKVLRLSNEMPVEEAVQQVIGDILQEVIDATNDLKATLD